jgi:D-aspartate ligase
MSGLRHPPPPALLLGGVDLLRALALGGIPCASVSAAGALPRYSRFCKAALPWFDPLAQPQQLLASLLDFAAAAGGPPVLFYQGDADTLFLSRQRQHLAPHIRFAIPEAELVEQLIDKHRFQALARELQLPVPESITLSPDSPPERDLGFEFPVLVKPGARQLQLWQPLGGRAKALRIDSFARLREVWAGAARHGTSLMVQRLVPGDETRVESYHVYVDADGRTAGAFTGRKVRTYPREFGYSTALELTETADVHRLGADIVERLQLRGVAKLDFKRDPAGRLHLLEVNPRFNLWHHLGAVAGINIPALVYADLTGTRRPPRRRVRPGARWSKPLQDWLAVRAADGSLRDWLAWTLSARARSGVAANDPWLLAGWLLQRARKRLLTETRKLAPGP